MFPICMKHDTICQWVGHSVPFSLGKFCLLPIKSDGNLTASVKTFYVAEIHAHFPSSSIFWTLSADRAMVCQSPEICKGKISLETLVDSFPVASLNSQLTKKLLPLHRLKTVLSNGSQLSFVSPQWKSRKMSEW